MKVHGHRDGGRKSPTYLSWEAMNKRCRQTTHHNYAEYGGKGITICGRWRKFINFLEDMGVRPEGMTLDRIDPSGNYEPENCRWADAKTQRMNQRRMAAAACSS